MANTNSSDYRSFFSYDTSSSATYWQDASMFATRDLKMKEKQEKKGVSYSSEDKTIKIIVADNKIKISFAGGITSAKRRFINRVFDKHRAPFRVSSHNGTSWIDMKRMWQNPGKNLLHKIEIRNEMELYI